MAYIDESLKCVDFQNAVNENKKDICQSLRECIPYKKNGTEVKLAIIFLLLVKEDEKKVIDGNYRTQKIRNSLHYEEKIKESWDGDRDSNNSGANQVFSPCKLGNSTIYKSSIKQSLDSISDEDTIQDRLDKFKKAFFDNIDETENVDKEDLRQAAESNLEEYWNEILNNINEGAKKVANQTNKTYDVIKNEIKDMIDMGITQIILTGAPGTGKTKMAKEIAKGLGGEITWKEKENDENTVTYPHYEFVQFHPSYDYTDFVEGLRPVEVGNNITFKKMDGIFKHFCRKVAEANMAEARREKVNIDSIELDIKDASGEKSKSKYFFIIDEINRADLSKVFGELMYCLETDKRCESNRINTQYQNLKTYFEDETTEDIFANGFFIPKNVIVIGTMNDIDRSVESMDFALRRRFAWYEVSVNKVFLKGAFKNMMQELNLTNKLNLTNQVDQVAEVLANQVNNLNKTLKDKGKIYGLNEQYYISQGQFANLPKEEWDKLFVQDNNDEINMDAVMGFLKYVWELRIKLLLKEYVRGEDEIEEFLEQCQDSLLRKWPESGSEEIVGDSDDEE